MSSAARAASVSVLASLVVMATAGAQGTRVQFGAGGSLTVPTGNYHSDENGDGFNVGWQGAALVDFKMSRSPLGFRVDAIFGENGANDQLNADLSSAAGVPIEGKTKLFGANVDLTYNFRSSKGVQGYLLTGIGFYNVKFSAKSGNVTADTSKTKFAWNVGGGFIRRVGGITALFFELRYFEPGEFLGYKTTHFPITAGVRFGGL